MYTRSKLDKKNVSTSIPVVLKVKDKELYIRHKKNKSILTPKIHQATIFDNMSALSMSASHSNIFSRIKRKTGYEPADFTICEVAVTDVTFIKYLE